jgi:hypothetical protein
MPNPVSPGNFSPPIQNTVQESLPAAESASSSSGVATPDPNLASLPRRAPSPEASDGRSPKRARTETGVVRGQTFKGMALWRINQWIADAPIDKRADYEQAAAAIGECWDSPVHTTLVLKFLNIQTLPPLPSHLEVLDLSNCHLESPPDLRNCPNLKELTLFSCNAMTALPDLSNCSKLEIIALEHIPLVTVLPDLNKLSELKKLKITFLPGIQSPPDIRECKKLTKLKLENCDGLQSGPDLTQSKALVDLKFEAMNFQTLPDLTQCKNLERLRLENCNALRFPPDLTQSKKLYFVRFFDCDGLIAAPDLSHCKELTGLDMSECYNLTTAPDLRQCKKLKALELYNCDQLVTPPLLSTHIDMEDFQIQDTPLTSLPPNLLQLPASCTVQLSLGSLSEAVRRELIAAIDALPQGQGPQIVYDMVAAQPELPIRPLNIEAESWLAGSGVVWQSFSQENSAPNFSGFLSRIRQTSEYRNPALTKNVEERVGKLLHQLSKEGNTDLRQLCFAQADSAITSCNDRIALALLHIVEEVVHGDYDHNPTQLLKQGAGMHQLQQLERHARNKVATLRFVDEIEVHLGYLVNLSKEFNLPVQMNTMLYPACSNVDAPEIAAARAQLQRNALKANPDPELIAYLSAWSPLVALLKRPAMASVVEQHSQTIEAEIAAEKETLQNTLAALDSDDVGYELQAKTLQAQFDQVEAAVTMRRHSATIVKLTSGTT